MFGYVIINKPEMKFKEFDIYHSYYCGLCRALKSKYGFIGQSTLSYDMTFLYMLLTSLYEPQTKISSYNCIAHPFEKQKVSLNEYAEYVADMNIIMTYYKCKDDWVDDKKVSKLLYSGLLSNKCGKTKKAYGNKVDMIVKLLHNIYLYEQEENSNLDELSGEFGNLMAELFVYKKDEWESSLRKIGFYLGKFIYIMDAYEDIEKDIKSNSFNPLKEMLKEEDFDDKCRKLLTMMIAECSKEFETLPIIENIEILRNILYSGVWCRYKIVCSKRNEKQVNKDD